MINNNNHNRNENMPQNKSNTPKIVEISKYHE